MYSHDLQTCDWPRNVACKTSNVIDDTLDLAIAIDSKKVILKCASSCSSTAIASTPRVLVERMPALISLAFFAPF